MLRINDHVSIPFSDIEWHAIRAQGPGGQNVNKVSSAVHLRFDIQASSLPESVKATLLTIKDKRLAKDGIIVIKAQQYRRQDQNYNDALQRLADFIAASLTKPTPRRTMRPTRRAIKRRLDHKKKHSLLKASRRKVDVD